MFFFKKICGLLFSPLSLSLEILLFGLVFLWCTRRQRTGKMIVTLGTLLLLLLSYGPVSHALLGSLERRYLPVKIASASESGTLSLGQVKYIVVLGGGILSDPNIPEASWLSPPTLIRLVESIRLHRELPGTKLVLSGGAVLDAVPEAEAMAAVAKALGVNLQELVLDKKSKDTEEQARNIKGIVGQDRFYLVTSAGHLPRAVALFRKQGMEPIPCPVGQMVKKRPAVDLYCFFPTTVNLSESEIAFHEYLGLTWAKLRGLL